MPYPARERKKPEIFQAFEDGDKHAPVSSRVEQARRRKKERERKSKGKDNGEEIPAKQTNKQAAKS